MAILDVESLLIPISNEEPCGPNLEYDSDYADFEKAARGTREQQYGQTIIPGEEPNWREVRRLGLEMLTRTMDLRVGCQLARGLLEIDGFSGFVEGLGLVRGYLERYWLTVHPQLDPDDGNDPTLRVNTVSSLSDQATTVQSLRTVPMVSAPGAGRFSLRDLGIALGDIAPPTDREKPTIAAIEAAFTECDLEQLRNNAAAIGQCLDATDAIETILTQNVGSTRAVSLESLRDTIQEIQTVLTSNLSRREPRASEDLPVEQFVTADGLQVPAARSTGEIGSREDVVRVLDRICDYYARNEPSSPVPLLLGRAKRLATKSFLEIVKDLTPDSMAQIRALGGVDDAESGD